MEKKGKQEADIQDFLLLLTRFSIINCTEELLGKSMHLLILLWHLNNVFRCHLK